jgi:formylmethanofuran dehydrogenase subunit E
MLVHSELKTIADRYGALTPELAVGYCAVALAREHFGELMDLAVSVGNDTGAVAAVRGMMKSDRVCVDDRGRHLYIFFHLPTNSILRLELLSHALKLPPCCLRVEDAIVNGNPVSKDALLAYAAQVDAVIERMLAMPPKSLFSVSLYNCRPALEDRNELCRFFRCERCRNDIRLNRLFDVEGFRLCAPCAEVHPSWFERGRGVEGARG